MLTLIDGLGVQPTDLPQAGMIDWLTLKLDGSFMSAEDRQKVKSMHDRILKIDAVTGEQVWESLCRENIRTDSHQVTVSFGSTLQIQGSPARVVNGNNVFGALDIRKCFFDMVTFVSRYYSIKLPLDFTLWSCSKTDVTRNYDLGSLDTVLQAIDSFKHTKVGRQKLTSYETSVMWGPGSNLHKGKAYAKGPHARKLTTKGTAFYTEEELKKSDRLLRLEYSICRLMFKRLKDAGLNWYDLTPDHLISFHDSYFSQFISNIEVTDMESILKKLLANVGDEKGQIPTPGQARAAYDCYTRIRTSGKHVARSSFSSKATWYRHLNHLRSIGLGDADLQHLNVVPIKRRQIVLDQPVTCWGDIQLVEGM